MKSIMKNMGKSIAAKAFSAGVCLYLMSSKAFASNVSALKQGGKGSVNVEWPWMKFFNALADNLTGPLPMVLGHGDCRCCYRALFRTQRRRDAEIHPAHLRYFDLLVCRKLRQCNFGFGGRSYDYGAVRWKKICQKATRFPFIDLWLHRSIGWGFHAICSSVKLYSLSSAG